MTFKIPKIVSANPDLLVGALGKPCPGVEIYDEKTGKRIGVFRPSGSSEEKVRAVRRSFDKKDCQQSVFLFDVPCEDTHLMSCVIFREKRYQQIRGQLASLLRQVPSRSASADDKARWTLQVDTLVTEAVDCANTEPFFRKPVVNGFGVRPPNPEWATTYMRPQQEMDSWIQWGRGAGGAASACQTGCIVVPVSPSMARRAIRDDRGGTYAPNQLYDFSPNVFAPTFRFPNRQKSTSGGTFGYIKNVFQFFPDRGFYPVRGIHYPLFVMGGDFLIDHARIWAEEIVNRPMEHYVLTGLHNWVVHILEFQQAGMLGLSAAQVRDLQEAAWKASDFYQGYKRNAAIAGGALQTVGGILIATGNVYAAIAGVVLIIIGLLTQLSMPAYATRYVGIDACPRLPFVRQPVDLECSLSSAVTEEIFQTWRTSTLPNLQRATGYRFTEVGPPAVTDNHEPPPPADSAGKILLMAGGAVAVGGIGYALLRRKS